MTGLTSAVAAPDAAAWPGRQPGDKLLALASSRGSQRVRGPTLVGMPCAVKEIR